MTLEQWFYIIASIGWVLMIAILLFVAVRLWTTLKIISMVLEDVHNTIRDLRQVKNFAKVGTVGLVAKGLSLLWPKKKGGEA